MVTKYCEYQVLGKCNATGTLIDCPYTFYDLVVDYDCVFNRGGYFPLIKTVKIPGCNAFKAPGQLEQLLLEEIKNQKDHARDLIATFDIKRIKI